jgi:hypothetical protein
VTADVLKTTADAFVELGLTVRRRTPPPCSAGALESPSSAWSTAGSSPKMQCVL